MKKFLQEFKDFAFKGNIIDLAVAVVMGGAFNMVITGFVTHIISPVIAMLTGGNNLSAILLGPIQIGAFIQVLIDFIIKALAIFIALKTYNTLNKAKEVEEVAAEPVVEVNEELETLKAILVALKEK